MYSEPFPLPLSEDPDTRHQQRLANFLYATGYEDAALYWRAPRPKLANNPHYLAGYDAGCVEADSLKF